MYNIHCIYTELWLLDHKTIAKMVWLRLLGIVLVEVGRTWLRERRRKLKTNHNRALNRKFNQSNVKAKRKTNRRFNPKFAHSFVHNLAHKFSRKNNQKTNQTNGHKVGRKQKGREKKHSPKRVLLEQCSALAASLLTEYTTKKAKQI